MKKAIITLSLLMITASAFAKDELIEKGFNAFREGGAVAAFSAWAKNGPLEGTKELKAQAAQFGQIGTFYGDYAGHDYFLTKQFGPNNKVVFLIMNLEMGPLYGRFLMYKNPDGVWTSPNFNFHTYPEQIWPSEFFSGLVE